MAYPGRVVFLDRFLDESNRLGYKVFRKVESKPINLNIVGWRNKNGRVNHFDDTIGVYYETVMGWTGLEFPATTMPGITFLRNPLNVFGTAILVPGQYLRRYKLGKFKDKDALRQIRSVSVYRDIDKDDEFDKNADSIDTGMFGIHIHRAGKLTKLVGLSSAGCQVFQNEADFEQFIRLIRVSLKYWDNVFSYTLFEY